MNHEAAMAVRNAIEVAIGYHQQGKLGEAEAIYRKVLQVEPQHATALHLLGVIAFQVKRHADAIMLIKKAIAINPSMGEAYNNLGAVCHDIGDLAPAIDNYRMVIKLKPNDPQGYHNLALVQADMGNLDSAQENYLRAIRIAPGYAEAHNSLGLLLLLRQSFDRGWQECQWRLKRPDCGLPAFSKPPWDGSPIEGKTILVHHEQGIGDTIMFMRYVPALLAYGARKVLLKVQTPLLSLLESTDAQIEVIDESVVEGALQYDLYVALLTLPCILKADLSNVPYADKYLQADVAKVNYYKDRFIDDIDSVGLRVGIVWQGNPLHRKDRERSVPLSYFLPLTMIKGVRLYSLQKGHGLQQLQSLPDGVEITDLGSHFNDFSDTAAAMDNLDIVITVDTATAHLSGALGLPTWVILPFVADWRWFLGGETSPWYHSARLFRQPAPGRWDDVFTRICKELETTVNIVREEAHLTT